MSYNVLKEWKTKQGHLAVIIETSLGHLCGYVAIDESNPLFGKDYSQHCDCLMNAKNKALEGEIGKRGIISIFCYDGESASMEIVFDVHGGVTYTETRKDYPIKTDKEFHWIGFDCAHAGDNRIKCNEEYVKKECESLSKQINEAVLDKEQGK